MGKPFQIIETRGIPEADYHELIRAVGGPVVDPEEGELDPGFASELRQTLVELDTGSAKPIRLDAMPAGRR